MSSFSKQVKQELAELNNLSKKNQVIAELYGYFYTFEGNVFSTESEYNINRFSKLLSNVDENNYKINIKGNYYTIKFNKNIKPADYNIDSNDYRSFVRGTFMATGTITNPQNVYHLEIIFDIENNAKFINEILNENNIKSKIIKRKNKFLIYIEDGDNISEFLVFIGANKGMLNFEETRVLKNVRNKINRMVNFETANLSKTINSSVKQIDYIKELKDKGKFKILSDKEKELANLRLKNPNATLTDLGKMLKPELGKSGVYHRMENIIKKSKEL